jgi:hypothetical protein
VVAIGTVSGEVAGYCRRSKSAGGNAVLGSVDNAYSWRRFLEKHCHQGLAMLNGY